MPLSKAAVKGVKAAGDVLEVFTGVNATVLDDAARAAQGGLSDTEQVIGCPLFSVLRSRYICLWC